MKDELSKGEQSRTYRIVTACVGMLFAICGVYLLVAGDAGWPGGLIAALVLVGLGADAVISALRNRRSLMARIGPLP